MSRRDVSHDPNYRHVSAYEYGALRDIYLNCILSGDGVILWSYQIAEQDGMYMVCGGFTGPFEALAAALQHAKEQATGKT